MPPATGFRRLRRFTFGGADLRRAVDDEFTFHLETATRELIAAGLDPRAAREEAERRFGDREAFRAACQRIGRRRRRAQWRGELMHDVVQDLHFALRGFRQSPGFVVAAVLTLALGIGATTAIFSVVYGVLLKPLPLPDPDRLVTLWESNPERRWTQADAAPANLLDWRERSRTLADVTAYIWRASHIALSGAGEPTVLPGVRVFGNFFSVLGTPPVVGRGFRFEESWDGEDRVVVIGDGFWRRRFGADPGIVGRAITLDGVDRVVVGVMPPGFSYPFPGTDVWIPFGFTPAYRQSVAFRRAHFVRPVARLRPGVSVAQAREDLETIAAQLSKEYPETNATMGAGITPLSEWTAGGTRPTLLILLGSVALVLVVACANVANLQLARGTLRRRELAVRSALGAGRGRLCRQLLTESVALAIAGGAVGLSLGFAGLRALLALSPGDLPRQSEIGLHGPVLLFAVAVTLVTGLLFGFAPALHAARASADRTLRGGGRSGTAGRRDQRARSVLVVSEIALAAVLVVAAGLLLRSFGVLIQLDPNFHPAGTIAVDLSLPRARYDEVDRVTGFYRRLLDRARALPGVVSAGLSDGLPLEAPGWSGDFAIAGRAREDFGVEFRHRRTSPDYFATLGVPILAGRNFTDADDGTVPVALVSESLARHYFAGSDPLGQRLTFDRYPTAASVWRTIVGVVADEKYDRLGAPGGDVIYEPFLQSPSGSITLVVRAAVAPLSILDGLRAQVAALDPAIPLDRPRTLDEVVDHSLARERFLTLLVGLFAAVALALALVGIYGLMAFAVSQRRREIGIRIALGAVGRQVLGLVVGRALALVVIGLALGLVGALLAVRLLRGVLYQVSATDPATFAAVAAVLAATALAASYLPARRAARIDPVETLRQE